MLNVCILILAIISKDHKALDPDNVLGATSNF